MVPRAVVLEEQNLKNEFRVFVLISSVISGIGFLIRLALKALMTGFPVLKRELIRCHRGRDRVIMDNVQFFLVLWRTLTVTVKVKVTSLSRVQLFGTP